MNRLRIPGAVAFYLGLEVTARRAPICVKAVIGHYVILAYVGDVPQKPPTNHVGGFWGHLGE